MGAIFEQVSRLDETWMLRLASRRAPGWLDVALRWGTHLGGASATLCVGALLAAIPGARDTGLAALIANASSHVVAQLLKRRFHRRRPHLTLLVLDPLVPTPDEFSFPSGHACAAMAVAASIAAAAPLAAGIGAVAVALLVAFSRVYLRVHFVTDVLMGSALGLGGAMLGWMVVQG
jgi:undecaprenyl-diphosphatase